MTKLRYRLMIKSCFTYVFHLNFLNSGFPEKHCLSILVWTSSTELTNVFTVCKFSLRSYLIFAKHTSPLLCFFLMNVM